MRVEQLNYYTELRSLLNHYTAQKQIKSERLNPVLAPTISLKVQLVTALFIPYVS